MEAWVEALGNKNLLTAGRRLMEGYQFRGGHEGKGHVNTGWGWTKVVACFNV
jgi:hypothetical protein